MKLNVMKIIFFDIFKKGNYNANSKNSRAKSQCSAENVLNTTRKIKKLQR
jgi:hypothetical protein